MTLRFDDAAPPLDLESLDLARLKLSAAMSYAVLVMSSCLLVANIYAKVWSLRGKAMFASTRCQLTAKLCTLISEGPGRPMEFPDIRSSRSQELLTTACYHGWRPECGVRL